MQTLVSEIQKFWPTPKHDILVVLGPTAVGKSALALALAEVTGAEIISADAYQVYRGLDIATAKVDLATQARIKHHLIDIMEPTESFNVARFLALSAEIIDEVRRRHKPIIICGGTGFYLRAFCFSYEFTEQPNAEVIGQPSSWDRLVAIDPIRAHAIHPHNRQRIDAALRVHAATGALPSDLNPARTTLRSDIRLVGLRMERSLLVQRIEKRVSEMIDHGLIAEIEGLLKSGVPAGAPSMSAIGVREVVAFLRDPIFDAAALATLAARIAIHTRQFAKRQMTWFNRLPEVNWFDLCN